jgi:imidazolonepropionase-like amidohydrolase
MILNNVRLIGALSGGTDSESGCVEVENGRIKAVSAEAYAAEGGCGQETVIDCGGKTLLPGLIDLHTHIVVLGGIGMDQVHDVQALQVTAAKHATSYLDSGFTTIRDCGSTWRVANYVRDMVKQGILDAPDIISCGRALMPISEGDPNWPFSKHIVTSDGPDEVLKNARTELGMRADFVKIFASGAAANPAGRVEECIMMPEEIRAAVEAARRKGTYVAAHCHSDDAIRSCAENGVYTIEHATLISDETLEYIISLGGKVRLVPTLAVMYISDGPRKEYWQKRLGPMFDHCTSMMEKAYSAGLKLGFGTDCPAGMFEYENGIEFKFRKENCRMKDLDILLQATAVNAEIAGIGDSVGQIKEGLKADLILVDGKPDLDISAMYKKPEKVWKNGKLVRG